MSIRPSGDTAGGFVLDDFVDKQVVHVSATSFRSGAERVSMAHMLLKWTRYDGQGQAVHVFLNAMLFCTAQRRTSNLLF